MNEVALKPVIKYIGYLLTCDIFDKSLLPNIWKTISSFLFYHLSPSFVVKLSEKEIPLRETYFILLKMRHFCQPPSKINNKQVILIKLLFHPLPLAFLKFFGMMSHKNYK